MTMLYRKKDDLRSLRFCRSQNNKKSTDQNRCPNKEIKVDTNDIGVFILFFPSFSYMCNSFDLLTDLS